MKSSILTTTCGILLMLSSMAIAQDETTSTVRIDVPSGSSKDYKKGYLDGFVAGGEHSDKQGLKNHQKRVSQSQTNRRQAADTIRKTLTE